ncbi:MAG: hypothetical protein ACRYFU_08405 [Janthinobacterium lividum]
MRKHHDLLADEVLWSMDPKELQAINRRMEEYRQATEPESAARPLGITLIAGFQFFKAGVLLLVALLLRSSPEMVTESSSSLYPLLYLATRGRYELMSSTLQDGKALTEVLLVLGLYLGAIGLGILSVKVWARRTVMLSCGMTLVLWAKSSLWPDSTVLTSPDMTNFYVLLAIDAAVFMYLMQPSAVESFRSRAE